MWHALIGLDHRLFFLINNGLGHKSLDSFFLDLSSLGAWTIGLIAVAFLSENGRRLFWRHVLVLAAALALVGGVDRVIKNTVNRPRPSVVLAQQIADGTAAVRLPSSESLHRKSFPSGHSMTAFFFMVYIGLYRRPLRLWVLLLAGLVALSRVYLGVHFPSDCVAGGLLGGLGGWGAWRLFCAWNPPADSAAPHSAAA